MIQKGLRCRYQSAKYKFEFILKHFATDTSENHHLETSRYMRVVYFRDPKSGNGCNWVRMCFLYCIDISFFLNLNSTGILKILNIVVMKTILFFFALQICAHFNSQRERRFHWRKCHWNYEIRLSSIR